MRFDSLGFEISFECEVDPEFPGSGKWDVPVYGFARDRDGEADSLTDESFASRWGPALVARVTPSESVGWVGWFEAGGLGGSSFIVGTPDPHRVCAVNVGAGYLVRVDTPQQYFRLKEATVVKGARRVGSSLILWDDLGVMGIGTSGLLFRSPRLCMDGLEVIGDESGGIIVEVDVLEGGRERFSVDASSGLPIGRTPFDWSRSVRKE